MTRSQTGRASDKCIVDKLFIYGNVILPHFTGFSMIRTLIGPVNRSSSPQAGPAQPPRARKKQRRTGVSVGALEKAVVHVDTVL